MIRYRVFVLLRPALLTILFLASSCAVGPDYKTPEVALPERFSAERDPADVTPAEVDLSRWWKTLADPLLVELIQESVAANPDLQIASERIREARALLLINYAGLLPAIDTEGSYSRTENSKNAARSSNQGGGFSGPPSSSAEPTNLFDAGFDSSWELDLFGGTRRAIEAAQDTLEARVEGRRNALVTLLSEVAQSYVTLRGAQRESVIVQATTGAQKESLELRRLKRNAGLSDDLTVAQAEAQLAATGAKLFPLSSRIEQSVHRLSVLLGKEPAALKARLQTPAPIPQGPPEVPPGLPSELLKRRPDIRQAEREVAAATANIGVATADLFPKLTLTGRFGVRSENLDTLVNGNSLYWSMGPALSLPVLGLGAIWQNIQVQNSRQKQALISYQKTILSALEEVENALVAYDRERGRFEVLQSGVQSSRRALDLAEKMDKAGVVDFLNVLNTQQSLFQAEADLAQSEQALSMNLIALYKALGGGWEELDRGEMNEAGVAPGGR